MNSTGTRRRPPWSRALAVWVLVCAAVPAGAYVPRAERILEAVAEANRAAGRAVALALEVELRIGDGERPAAAGTLLTGPGGVSRLELRSPAGFVERHLIRGARLRASRGGLGLERPRPFLPPLYLIQAASGEALARELQTLGVRHDAVALGYEGEFDCYVLGGRPAPGAEPTPDASSDASLWVDQESLDVVRFERRDRVRFDFGPSAAFGGLRLPSWIEIAAPGQPAYRLTIRAAGEATPPADAFGAAWLAGP